MSKKNEPKRLNIELIIKGGEESKQGANVLKCFAGRVAQLARAFGSHPKGPRFESWHDHFL